MYKKLLMILIICNGIIFLLGACGAADSVTSTAGNTVYMNDTNFVQTSITIQKGEYLTLVAETFTPHVIANGTWENGTAHPTREPGAPQIKDMQINGNSTQTVGPFTTTGTFQLYCTIHANMNLTVVVQ